MTDKTPDLLEQMRADWQQTETPALGLDAIKRRLRWRWFHFGLDVLGLLVACIVLVWSTSWISGVLEWIYWSFFALFFVAAAVITVRWRLRALRRPDDSIRAVMDHARRDARLRVQAGRLAIATSAAVALFVAIWMGIAGGLDPAPLADFFGERIGALVFAAVWCLLGVVAGGWMRERGLRQLLELDRLNRELLE